jgi:hypothetical protein
MAGVHPRQKVVSINEAVKRKAVIFHDEKEIGRGVRARERYG